MFFQFLFPFRCHVVARSYIKLYAFFHTWIFAPASAFHPFKQTTIFWHSICLEKVFEGTEHKNAETNAERSKWNGRRQQKGGECARTREHSERERERRTKREHNLKNSERKMFAAKVRGTGVRPVGKRNPFYNKFMDSNVRNTDSTCCRGGEPRHQQSKSLMEMTSSLMSYSICYCCILSLLHHHFFSVRMCVPYHRYKMMQF